MEFLKIIKRRSFLSELTYITLNIVLTIVFVLIIRTTGSLWLAFLLILISKWRVFAVRPRFWFANIQADLVSFIVSASFVIFLYDINLSNIGSTAIFISQIFLALLYIGWLLFLKSQSKRVYVAAQAGVALFFGVTAIFATTYGWPASVVVAMVWLVGYATARHVFNSYDEESHTLLLSLAWGFGLAEISWLAYHWTIAYNLPIATGMLLPQVSIIVSCLGFLAYNAYDSYYHHQKVRSSDIILPLVFTIGLITMLILAFNSVNTGII